MTEITSHIKDIKNFISKITVPPNLLLVRMLVTRDVKSLYTSIPDNEGIASVKKKYDHYPKKTIPTKISAISSTHVDTEQLYIQLKSYLQIKICATGTICAPSYSNIIMSEFEEKYIYCLIKNKSVIYLRYIDDIFMVWIKSESEPRQFMGEINKKH